MKPKIIIILTLFSALAFSSCEKELARRDLTEAQLQLIPYKKGQIVSFISGAGLTIDFTVTSDELMWLRADIGGGNKYNDYIMFRRKSVTLKSEQTNFEIYLSIDACKSLLCNECSLTISIRQEYIAFYSSFDTEGNLLTYTYTYFHDSVEINGKDCFDVIEQNKKTEGYGHPNVPIQLFYNKTYGILQIKREGKNFLTLKN